MSDNEDQPSDEKPFCIDRAKQGRAACKKCKQKCLIGDIRIAKIVPSPYGSGKMKNWFHVNCIFEQFLKQRITTKRIESPDDIEGWDALTSEDQDEVAKEIEESEKLITEKYGLKTSPKKNEKNVKKTSTKNKSPLSPKTNKNQLVSSSPKTNKSPSASSSPKNKSPTTKKTSTSTCPKDCLFREFRRLVADISNVSSYTEKTSLVSKLFTKGSDGTGFKGDVTQWCRLLLPGVIQRKYNLKSKQLVKLLSKIFYADQNALLQHLEQGDIGETIQHFFEESKSLFKPAQKSLLTIQEVDDFLEELSLLTKEDEQMRHFKTFIPQCTSNDLKVVIRMIKQDLRMNAGAKHVLDGVHSDAYESYQSSRDLKAVIQRCLGGGSEVNGDKQSAVKATISPMTPVLPMLAEACKSVEQAMKKCPNGMYAEIKYDGERVQLHKQGKNFKYFSRSLKPVVAHKVAHFKDYIPQAFPYGKDLILDSEILMIDTISGKPLPFGSLGKHKKTEFKDANVCLFVFDCIHYNGESLQHKPLNYRKQILRENMTEIPNHIMFSELEEINDPEDLSVMIAKVLKQGLEGLVLKDVESIYEPGKRHWLKVKKDYLFEGAMADTADLVVLGAWYGTGKKGGMMSVFLMGCYDEREQKFCTVTKVHTGHDDKTLERLQSELDMIKISGDVTKTPDWLHCSKTMLPDFVARHPKKQPVWEITGAEFTQHDVHTADGISIRFPRCTRIRDDKTWKTATTLDELKTLYKNSKENTDVSLLTKNSGKGVEAKPNKKQKDTGAKANTPKRPHEISESPEQNQPKKKPKLEAEGSPSSEKIKKPLPDLFKDVRLLLEDGASEKYAEWIRYFIAYGGKVVSSENAAAATHVLHLKQFISEPTIVCANSARHIIVDWIKDTVANGNLLDFRPYSVGWDPTRKE